MASLTSNHQPALIATASGETESVSEDVCAGKSASESNDEEEIYISLNDEFNCYEIKTVNCRVLPANEKHYHGSSKVKLKNIVDFKWESKHYPGHLVAVHLDQNYLAYAINVNKHGSRMEGMVRVLNVSKGYRSLVKGMSGEVMDLQFAHIEKEHILATGDSNSLFVHKIFELEDSVVCNLLLKIYDPLGDSSVPKFDKIFWCPYVEIPGEDDEDNHLIVWSRGVIFQCFNVKIIVNEYGAGICKNAADLSVGYIKHEDSANVITCAALSPDGSTLGVGSNDGIIRFYQMYIHDKEPRCLHEWKPHGGKAISTFFFLDNLTERAYETYWKYAITTAEDNNELKIWDCGSWNCLQTIIFNPSGGRYIAEMDRTSSYLVLSCLDSRTCYVLEIIYALREKMKSISNEDNSNDDDDDDGIRENIVLRRDATRTSSTSSSNNSANGSNSSCTNNNSYRVNSNTNTGLRQSANELTHGVLQLHNMPVYIKSISAFSLSSGILAFTIVDAALRRYKSPNDNYICEEIDDYDEDTNSSIYCVILHMYVVQSKSLQECHILYQTKTPNADSKASAMEANNGSDRISETDITENSFRPVVHITDETEFSKKNILAAITSESKRDEVLETNTIDYNITKSKGPIPVEKTLSTNLILDITKDETNENLTILCNQQKLMSPFLNVSKKEELKASDENLEKLENEFVPPSTFPPSPPPSASPSINQSSLLNPTTQTTSMATKTYNAPLVSSINLMTPDAFTSSIDSSRSEQKTSDNINSEVFNTIRMLASATSNTSVTASIVNTASIKEDMKNGPQIEQLSPTDDLTNPKFISIDSGSNRLIGENMVSGGSSPSREVQEIMALTNFDKSSQNGGDLMDWPKPPEMSIGPTVSRSNSKMQKSSELQNAANLIYHSMPSNSISSSDLTGMDKKLQELLEINKKQIFQIEKLSQEVNELKSTNSLMNTKNVTEINRRLEAQLWKVMNQFMKHHETEMVRIYGSTNTDIGKLKQELREILINTMKHSMNSHINEIINQSLTMEIQKQLVPLINCKLDALQRQIYCEFTQKLNAFDLMIHENIMQACKNKTTIEILSRTLLAGVQSCLQNSLIESMSSTLIPAYEKSSRNMFQQLNNAFTNGIRDFLKQFENYLQQLQPLHDTAEDIIKKFSYHQEHLKTLIGQQEAKMQEVIHETRQDIKSIDISLSQHVQDIIQTEMRKSIETQAAVLRSHANTPALPSFDLKDTIKLLLMQGQINKAFHQALLANDLSLVEYTLTNVDHNVVFSPECCLEQKVLLSLIQQISADMSNHNDIKQNYLAEALLALNVQDSIIREHAPKVLQELIRNCQIFLVNYPKSLQYSNVRMLMRAVESYKDQF